MQFSCISNPRLLKIVTLPFNFLDNTRNQLIQLYNMHG